jgi:hypothetical protein
MLKKIHMPNLLEVVKKNIIAPQIVQVQNTVANKILKPLSKTQEKWQACAYSFGQHIQTKETSEENKKHKLGNNTRDKIANFLQKPYAKKLEKHNLLDATQKQFFDKGISQLKKNIRKATHANEIACEEYLSQTKNQHMYVVKKILFNAQKNKFLANGVSKFLLNDDADNENIFALIKEDSSMQNMLYAILSEHLLSEDITRIKQKIISANLNSVDNSSDSKSEIEIITMANFTEEYTILDFDKIAQEYEKIDHAHLYNAESDEIIEKKANISNYTTSEKLWLLSYFMRSDNQHNDSIIYVNDVNFDSLNVNNSVELQQACKTYEAILNEVDFGIDVTTDDFKNMSLHDLSTSLIEIRNQIHNNKQWQNYPYLSETKINQCILLLKQVLKTRLQQTYKNSKYKNNNIEFSITDLATYEAQMCKYTPQTEIQSLNESINITLHVDDSRQKYTKNHTQLNYEEKLIYEELLFEQNEFTSNIAEFKEKAAIVLKNNMHATAFKLKDRYVLSALPKLVLLKMPNNAEQAMLNILTEFNNNIEGNFSQKDSMHFISTMLDAGSKKLSRKDVLNIIASDESIFKLFQNGENITFLNTVIGYNFSLPEISTAIKTAKDNAEIRQKSILLAIPFGRKDALTVLTTSGLNTITISAQNALNNASIIANTLSHNTKALWNKEIGLGQATLNITKNIGNLTKKSIQTMLDIPKKMWQAAQIIQKTKIQPSIDFARSSIKTLQEIQKNGLANFVLKKARTRIKNIKETETIHEAKLKIKPEADSIFIKTITTGINKLIEILDNSAKSTAELSMSTILKHSLLGLINQIERTYFR